MQKLIKRATGIILTAIVLLSSQSVYATESDVFTEAGEDSDNVVITENDKPYLALGADLTAEQQHTVLSYMGIEAADLDLYDVVYVNNSEEHEYLGSYISSSEIGTRSLSSVVIKETSSGSGVNVSTYNINYCTAGMYKNALATAGITDADIIVAGPFSISGTAALVGVMKAYEKMSGEELDSDAVDAAMNELVVTGSIEEAIDGDSQQVETMIAELKEMAADGKFDNEEDIKDAIQKAAEEYDLTLSDENIQELTDFLMKLKDLDIDWDNIKNQAAALTEKLNDKLADLDAEGFWDKVVGFFEKIIDAIKSLFS